MASTQPTDKRRRESHRPCGVSIYYHHILLRPLLAALTDRTHEPSLVVTRLVLDRGTHGMPSGAETPKLHLLPPDNVLGVTVAPLNGDVAIGVGVDEHVEGAGAGVQLWEERHGCSDLSEYGGDFVLDLFFCLVF